MKLNHIIVVVLCGIFLSAGDYTPQKIGKLSFRQLSKSTNYAPVSRNLYRSLALDTVTVWFDDLEGNTDEWSGDSGWNKSQLSSYSPAHSFNVDDDNFDRDLNLVSPTIDLPELTGENEVIKFSFALWCNLPDFDGNNDNSLEDYYRVAVTNEDEIPLFFHRSTWNAFEGQSWWCGDPVIEGYDNNWLQTLESPAFTVSGVNPVLTAQIRYNLEGFSGASYDVGGCLVDGWDAANVRISNDDGASWQVLTGTPAYNSTSCFGWKSNGEACDIPGWGGTSPILNNGWVDASFDLSAYSGQTVKLRFYMGTDVGSSTADGDPYTGFQVDEIFVSNDQGDTLLFDNADDSMVMIPGSEIYLWEEVFYDYGDITRPGASDLGWQIYEPGDPFNGNAQLELTEYAGKPIRIRWQARLDDDNDGGNGLGLFIDDLHVWSVDLKDDPPVVANLEAEPGDSEVNLTWDDASTTWFNGLISYDNGNISGNSIGGVTGFSGTVFDMPYGVESTRIDTIHIFANDNDLITVAGFDLSGGVPKSEPDYEIEVNITAQTWNSFAVSNWDFNSDFVIATSIDSNTYTPLDITAVPSTQSWIASNGVWEEYQGGGTNNLPDGEWLIRASITSIGGYTARYNIYRKEGVSTYSLLTAGNDIGSTGFIDNTVVNGTQYCYQVTALYDDVESEPSTAVCVTPEAATIYELAYDDGTSNVSTHFGDGSYLAVKFTPLSYPAKLVRVKYFVPGETGGMAFAYTWDDDGTDQEPGTVLGIASPIQLVQGWNIKDVAVQNIIVDEGSIYIGWQENSTTPALGIDTESPPDNSYFNLGTAWEALSSQLNGALMIRVDLDSASTVGVDEDWLEPVVPDQFSLAQNYPNPFNPETVIEFSLPQAGKVDLILYNIKGQVVNRMIDASLGAGQYSYRLPGRNLASGIYFYTLHVNDSGRTLFSATRKLMLIK